MERLTAAVGLCKTRTKASSAKRGPRCPYSRIADKYGLRPRTIIRRLLQDRRPREASIRPNGKRLPPQAAARHRRKLVIARERCQEREIDQAFENLRQVLPVTDNCYLGDDSAEAKMMTLKMALRYIDALSRLLQEEDNDNDTSSTFEEVHSRGDAPAPRDEQETFPVLLQDPDDTKDVPAEDDSPSEDTYILALAKIFDESDYADETSPAKRVDQPCVSDGEDVSSSRDDFSDLSDHDLEGQLDVLANLSRLSGSEALLLSKS